ncbi:MAG TPA: Spy/CpxP family protein refolding chaperone [Terriglobales bacterium]|nr:Spy/CpxP family protein refolding chaperone [Terriglobales bacterium]
MNKTHVKGLGALVLAAAFVAALWPAAAGAQEQPAPQDQPQAQPGAQVPARPRDMIRDLGITPDQEKQIREFREARMKDRQAFRDQMVKMRAEMRDLAKDPKANAARIDEFIDSISKLRADHEKAAFRARGDFERIFTPEQLQKMKAFRGTFAGRAGSFRPGMGRIMGLRGGWGMGPGFRARAAWGWRTRAGAWRWRHPFFWYRF